MKNPLPSLWKLILLSFVCLLFSCATTRLNGTSEVGIINVGSYTIEVPRGWAWVYNKVENEGITLTKAGQSIFGKLMAAVGPNIPEHFAFIRVFKHRVSEDNASLSEEQMADDFRSQGEKIIVEQGIKSGLHGLLWYRFLGHPPAEMEGYDLKYVRKDTTSVNGKKLYTMSYKTSAGTLVGGVSPKGSLRVCEGILYLYFPPNFEGKHHFYGFHISQTYLNPTLGKIDLTEIHNVIKSFHEVEE